jgi:hypothetical protein
MATMKAGCIRTHRELEPCVCEEALTPGQTETVDADE